MKLLFRLTFLLMCIIVTSCTDSFEEPECARDYIPESFAKDGQQTVDAINGLPKKLFKFDSIKFLWQPNQSFLQRPLLILHNCVKGDGTNQAMRKFSRLPI